MIPTTNRTIGIRLLKQRNIIVRFFDTVRKSFIFWTEALKGLIIGRKIKAPIILIVRWTSQTPIAAGLPVARAANITSKTVPIFAPSI